ncbi:MAG: alkaline phosphatase PhoX [Pseudomonadota bacterium]
MDRRRFLQCIAAAAATPALPVAVRASGAGLGPLAKDPNKLLDIPRGFELTVVSLFGDAMSDGLKVPALHDGMAAFDAGGGRVALVCNHEMLSHDTERSAFGTDYDSVPDSIKQHVYDNGRGLTPGAGGTTTTIYDPVRRTTERQHLSLAGTEINCAGGPTPWGSWLSCEECFEGPGESNFNGGPVYREKRHGYVFEIPARSEGLVDPVPLKAMGRFEHEATAVHEPTGIVYLTEDRHNSLFYRFLPASRGELIKGGRLQALAIVGRPSQRTHNWSASADVEIDTPLAVEWMDLDNVDPLENDLRLRGAKDGAATFARGEGLCNAAGDFVFTCTIGGPARLGQVFRYTPSRFEGTREEKSAPGTLTLIAESTENTLLRNADNLTLAPWGDLIVCEDTSSASCSLIGIRPDGEQYLVADNAYSSSELAGVCFSPDGKTLFVNIQYPGTTVAITGPWPEAA